MIKAKNLWEQNALRKLTTLDAVDAEIDRCVEGQAKAPTDAKLREWGNKLAFLARLRSQVSSQQ